MPEDGCTLSSHKFDYGNKETGGVSLELSNVLQNGGTTQDTFGNEEAVSSHSSPLSPSSFWLSFPVCLLLPPSQPAEIKNTFLGFSNRRPDLSSYCLVWDPPPSPDL